ncbi:MAG: beta-galactosidase small subunit, partial [Opitutales bacterium]
AKPAPRVVATATGGKLAAGGLSFEVNRAGGVLENFRRRGRVVIARGPRLNVWRAPTDNDGLKLFPVVNWGGARGLTDWLAAGYNRLELADSKVSVQPGPTEVVVDVEQRWLVPGARRFITHIHRYTLDGAGALQVANEFAIDRQLPELPRLGVSLVLPTEFEQLAWLGRGPWENYTDRKRSAMVGLYRTTVTADYVPYIVPQEHGNKTDVRWLHLHDRKGRGVRFLAQPKMEASASHYPAADLFAAKHTTDLVARPEVQVNLDYAQRGLGTASCGPDTLPQYRIEPGAYRFGFAIEA